MKPWWMTFFILFLGAGCATTPPYDPFQIPRAEVHSRIKTIALSPVNLPRMAEKKEGVKEKIESLVTEKLKEAGYTVLPSKEFGAIWDRLTDQMGGFYDPITGKGDEAKIKTVREHARREMAARFKVDALLHPMVQVVGARVKSSRAAWDGISESVLIGDWYSSHDGTTQALSVVVIIEDLNGVNLYANRGGIQLIRKISRGTFVDVPDSQILAKQDLITEAVNIAMKPFFEKTGPQ